MKYLTADQENVIKSVVKESMRQAFINTDLPIPNDFDETSKRVSEDMINKVQIEISRIQKLKVVTKKKKVIKKK